MAERSKTSREEIAKELKAVLDERFTGDLEKLSRTPLSNVDDGLGPDYERAGTPSSTGRSPSTSSS